MEQFFTLPLPVFNIPEKCYAVTWKLYRHDVDMLVEYPEIFEITGNGNTAELTICTPDETDYAMRIALYGDGSDVDGEKNYILRGTVAGEENPTTPTEDFDLTITFEDACRTATINDQASPIVWTVERIWQEGSKNHEIPAFDDTVDVT